jgi:hypothetical protein
VGGRWLGCREPLMRFLKAKEKRIFFLEMSGSGTTTNPNDLKKTAIVPMKEDDTFIITFHCTFGDDSFKIIKNIDQARKDKIITDPQYLNLLELREQVKPEIEKLNRHIHEPEGFTTITGKYTQHILTRDITPLILSSLAFGILGYFIFFNKQK